VLSFIIPQRQTAYDVSSSVIARVVYSPVAISLLNLWQILKSDLDKVKSSGLPQTIRGQNPLIIPKRQRTKNKEIKAEDYRIIYSISQYIATLSF